MSEKNESARKLLVQLLNEGQGLAWWEIKDNTVALLLREGLLTHRRQEPVSIFVSEPVRKLYQYIKEAGGETDLQTLMAQAHVERVPDPLHLLRKMVKFEVLVLNKEKKTIKILS